MQQCALCVTSLLKAPTPAYLRFVPRVLRDLPWRGRCQDLVSDSKVSNNEFNREALKVVLQFADVFQRFRFWAPLDRSKGQYRS